jgi:hypothetical protein
MLPESITRAGNAAVESARQAVGNAVNTVVTKVGEAAIAVDTVVRGAARAAIPFDGADKFAGAMNGVVKTVTQGGNLGDNVRQGIDQEVATNKARDQHLMNAGEVTMAGATIVKTGVTKAVTGMVEAVSAHGAKSMVTKQGLDAAATAGSVAMDGVTVASATANSATKAYQDHKAGQSAQEAEQLGNLSAPKVPNAKAGGQSQGRG